MIARSGKNALKTTSAIWVFFVVALFAVPFGCDSDEAPAPILVTSIAFGDEENMPIRHTCDGDGISPPLSFSPGPEKTESFALVMVQKDEDTSAVSHWLMWGIDPSERFIGEGQPQVESPKDGVFHGTHSGDKLGYLAPCPEDFFPHRYVFKVYALDKILNLEGASTQPQLTAAMDGHVVGYGELVGRYQAD